MAKRASGQTRTKKMSDAELDFLWRLSTSKPGTWKTDLNWAWAFSSTNSPESMSIRNRIGPSGLLSLTRVMINEEWQLRRRMKARGA